VVVGRAVLGAGVRTLRRSRPGGDELGEVLAVTRPKSSSPTSGGIWLKLPRERKMVMGLRIRWRCLVCGTSGRKMSSERVCVHQRMRAVGLVSVTKKEAR